MLVLPWLAACAISDLRSRTVGVLTSGGGPDFAAFPDFLAAVKHQIQYMTAAFVAQDREALRKRFTQGDPKLYRTLFTRDCVRLRIANSR